MITTIELDSLSLEGAVGCACMSSQSSLDILLGEAISQPDFALTPVQAVIRLAQQFTAGDEVDCEYLKEMVAAAEKQVDDVWKVYWIEVDIPHGVAAIKAVINTGTAVLAAVKSRMERSAKLFDTAVLKCKDAILQSLEAFVGPRQHKFNKAVMVFIQRVHEASPRDPSDCYASRPHRIAVNDTTRHSLSSLMDELGLADTEYGRMSVLGRYLIPRWVTSIPRFARTFVPRAVESFVGLIVRLLGSLIRFRVLIVALFFRDMIGIYLPYCLLFGFIVGCFGAWTFGDEMLFVPGFVVACVASLVATYALSRAVRSQ